MGLYHYYCYLRTWVSWKGFQKDLPVVHHHHVPEGHHCCLNNGSKTEVGWLYHTFEPQKIRERDRGKEGQIIITYSKVIKVVWPIFQLLIGPTLESAVVIGCIDSTKRELQADASVAFYVLYLKHKILLKALYWVKYLTWAENKGNS